VDISTPANPAEAGLYDPLGYVYDVAAAGGYAYVTNGDGLQVLDISTPSSPTQVGFRDTPGSARSLAVAGNHAYIADSVPFGDSGLRVVDVSDPANPAEMGSCAVSYISSIAVAGSHAYATGGHSLQVLDVSNPANPWEVGSYDAPGYAEDVVVVGNYAYVAEAPSGYWGGLRVIDVTTPWRPMEVGFYDTPGYPYGVAISGSHAYVADGDPGLRIVNVSNPYNPWEEGAYETPGSADDVAVAGDFVYIAEYAAWAEATGQEIGGGLRVVDVSDPTNPTEVGFYDTPGGPGKVATAGGYVYVAHGDMGLFVLRFPPRASAVIPVAGGSLVSDFDWTTYTFASGAFTDTAIVTHTLRPLSQVPSTGDLVGIGHFFDVTAVYSTTGQPAQLAPGQAYTLTVEYSDTAGGLVIEDTLGLYWWDGGVWSQQGITGTVNTADNLVSAQVDHLSLFAVLGEMRRVYLPVVLRDH
jgi:hypothetical protein